MKTIEYKPTNYPSDLTDRQWEQISEFFPQTPNNEHHKRTLVNAVLYLIDNGCKWRSLPHDYPSYSTVYSFYRRACIDGIWEKVLQAVVTETRLKAGRNPNPSLGIIDSQSVKTVYSGIDRGVDGGKKNQRTKTPYRS